MAFWSANKVWDPVCGMELDPKKAAESHAHGGRTYYFCSAACKALFIDTPDRYAKLRGD